MLSSQGPKKEGRMPCPLTARNGLMGLGRTSPFSDAHFAHQKPWSNACALRFCQNFAPSCNVSPRSAVRGQAHGLHNSSSAIRRLKGGVGGEGGGGGGGGNSLPVRPYSQQRPMRTNLSSKDKMLWHMYGVLLNAAQLSHPLPQRCP